jgi:hypothetical protein
LHAIWLAESGKELAVDIPHVLDLTTETLPVQDEVAQAFAVPDLKQRAAAAMRRVLDSIDADTRGRPLGYGPRGSCHIDGGCRRTRVLGGLQSLATAL